MPGSTPRASGDGYDGPVAVRGRAALFLDRDGTIIEDAHYLASADEVRLLPGAAEAIAAVNRAGVPVVVVTNQSGIGRGYFDLAAYHNVAARVDELLAERGARIDATYFCPHAPGAGPECACRKPAAGLFLQAARDHGLDLKTSTFVGDRVRDVKAGLEAGGRAFLVRAADPANADGEIPPGVTRVSGLAEAVAHLLRRG